jgi:hypothetical protein
MQCSENKQLHNKYASLQNLILSSYWKQPQPQLFTHCKLEMCSYDFFIQDNLINNLLQGSHYLPGHSEWCYHMQHSPLEADSRSHD